jgi:hypothetical protein
VLRAGRDTDDRIGVAGCLDNLGWVAASQQQAARALTLLAAADAAWAARRPSRSPRWTRGA